MKGAVRQSSLDVNEAPPGYFAVLKDDVVPKDSNENCCRFCDWQSECQKGNHITRCVSDAVIRQDGSLWERKDGCSVVFKNLQGDRK